MPEYNPSSGPEPKRPVMGWVMLAIIIGLFLCVLIIAVLLPWLSTPGAAYGCGAIAVTGAFVVGLLARWMVNK